MAHRKTQNFAQKKLSRFIIYELLMSGCVCVGGSVTYTHHNKLFRAFFYDAVSVEVAPKNKEENVNLLSLMAAEIYRKELITFLPCQSALN